MKRCCWQHSLFLLLKGGIWMLEELSAQGRSRGLEMLCISFCMRNDYVHTISLLNICMKILIFKNLFHTWFWFRCLNWYKMFVLFFHVMISCYWWLTRKSVLNWHGLFITPTIMVSGFHVCFWMNIPLLAFV